MKHYLTNKYVKLFLIVLFISNTQLTIGQSKIEYTNNEQNLNISLEVPELQHLIKFDEISKNIKLFFDKRVIEYEIFLKEKPYSKLPITLNFSIDSFYSYEKYIIIVYILDEENIPIYNSSRWVETLVFDAESGKEIKLSICQFLNCKEPIPLHKIVNSKISNPACQLVEDDSFHLKYFVPKQNSKFIIFTWSELGRNTKECQNTNDILKIEFTKEELLKLTGNNSSVRYVTSPRSYIYSSLDPLIQTKMYLIKGDKVEFVTEQKDWAKIRFYGKKMIEGWVKKIDINKEPNRDK